MSDLTDHNVPLGRVTIRNKKEHQLAFLEKGFVGAHVTGTDGHAGPRSRWDIGPEGGHFTIVNDGTGLFAFNHHPHKPHDPVVANRTPRLYDIRPIPHTKDEFTISTTDHDRLFWALEKKNGNIVVVKERSDATTWIIRNDLT